MVRTKKVCYECKRNRKNAYMIETTRYSRRIRYCPRCGHKSIIRKPKRKVVA